MILHGYDPVYQLYTRSFEAHLDPIETAIKGEKTYLIPANCTDVAPPEKVEGKVAQWDGIKWILLEDNRGSLMWRTTPPFSVEIMNRPGMSPGGYTFVPPPEPGPYEYLVWEEDRWKLKPIPHATEEKIIENLTKVTVRRKAIQKAIELGWLPSDYPVPSYPKP